MCCSKSRDNAHKSRRYYGSDSYPVQEIWFWSFQLVLRAFIDSWGRTLEMGHLWGCWACFWIFFWRFQNLSFGFGFLASSRRSYVLFLQNFVFSSIDALNINTNSFCQIVYIHKFLEILWWFRNGIWIVFCIYGKSAFLSDFLSRL